MCLGPAALTADEVLCGDTRSAAMAHSGHARPRAVLASMPAGGGVAVAQPQLVDKRAAMLNPALPRRCALDAGLDARSRRLRFREHVQLGIGPHEVRVVADREPAILGELREVRRAVRHPGERLLEPSRQRVGGGMR